MKSLITPSVAGFALCLAAAATALPARALTPAEATGVLYLKQEEKLARDVYQVLAARWDQAVFRNLALAEQRHLDAVNGLIARYDLDDPAPAEPGRFSIPELQSLYDQLLARGQSSLTGALQAGVVIEETDIADLREVAAATTEAPIQRVMANLLRASERHFEALSAALGTVANGGTLPAGAGVCGRNAGGGQAPACGDCPKQTGTCTGEGRANQGMNRQSGAGCGAKAGAGAGAGCGGSCPTTTPTPTGTPKPVQRRAGR